MRGQVQKGTGLKGTGPKGTGLKGTGPKGTGSKGTGPKGTGPNCPPCTSLQKCRETHQLKQVKQHQLLYRIFHDLNIQFQSPLPDQSIPCEQWFL